MERRREPPPKLLLLQSRKAVENRAIPSVSDSRVRWVLEWVGKSDLSHSVRTEDLAKAVHMSRSRLRHLFRTEVGVPLGKYLKLLRLGRARDLLSGSFLEVKEVAAIVGIIDVSHFVRDYKAVYAETPSQTRLRSKSA
jgi:transcriptional regulator GlxA family with amidase domain